MRLMWSTDGRLENACANTQRSVVETEVDVG